MRFFFNSKLVSGVSLISEALLCVIIVAIVIVYYNPKIILMTFMILHRIKWYQVVSVPHAPGHNDTSAKLFGMTYAALNVNVGSWNRYISGACVNVGCHIDGILIAICTWYLWWLDALKLMQVLLDIVYIYIYISPWMPCLLAVYGNDILWHRPQNRLAWWICSLSKC